MPRNLSILCLTGLGLVACGGSSGSGGSANNGVASKPPDAVVTAARQAADTASAVHLSGSIAGSGAPTTFDLNLVKGTGGRGTLSVNGLSFELMRIGSTIYVKGSPAFYQKFSGAAAALLNGKWLKGASTSGSFAAIGPFTDLTGFVDKALANQPGQKLTKGGTSTIAGQKVVEIKDANGGTLSVAETGKPFPVRIAQGGSSGGSITFDRWNAPVTLTPPADAVDLAQLQKGK